MADIDIVLAVLVFNNSGYRKWQAATATPLLPRVLAAFGIGFTWPLRVSNRSR
jgi:hypothetical protein